MREKCKSKYDKYANSRQLNEKVMACLETGFFFNTLINAIGVVVRKAIIKEKGHQIAFIILMISYSS